MFFSSLYQLGNPTITFTVSSCVKFLDIIRKINLKIIGPKILNNTTRLKYQLVKISIDWKNLKFYTMKATRRYFFNILIKKICF